MSNPFTYKQTAHCSGNGCPLRFKCERPEYAVDNIYGSFTPPHDVAGQFPRVCVLFVDKNYKPAIKQFETGE